MLQGNPGTINPHLTARTYQPNPSYQYQTIGNENNSGPGLMISLQTPTHDPRLTVLTLAILMLILVIKDFYDDLPRQ